MSNSGHRPVHSGLQNHSIGGAYPLCVVGYGHGDTTTWVIENLATSEVYCHSPDDPYQWQDSYEYAGLVLEGIIEYGASDRAMWVKGRPHFTTMDYLEM